MLSHENVRPARPEDAGEIVRLIKDLARYEKLGRFARPDVDKLHEELRSTGPQSLKVWVAIYPETHKVIGFALCFMTYSTFLTAWQLYLEDIFVEKEYRSLGFGRLLFEHIAEFANSAGCKRLDFQVLSWNKKSIFVYEKLGVKKRDGWFSMRIEGAKLKGFANKLRKERLK